MILFDLLWCVICFLAMALSVTEFFNVDFSISVCLNTYSDDVRICFVSVGQRTYKSRATHCSDTCHRTCRHFYELQCLFRHNLRSRSSRHRSLHLDNQIIWTSSFHAWACSAAWACPNTARCAGGSILSSSQGPHAVIWIRPKFCRCLLLLII